MWLNLSTTLYLEKGMKQVMRKGLQNVENIENKNYKIIAVDDEQGIIDSLSIFLKRKSNLP